MRWQGRRQSQNVEDRRSLGRDVAVGGGLLTLLIMGAALFFPDLVPVLKLFEAPPGARQAAPAKPINDEMGAFLRTVVADNEDVWAKLFPQAFNKRFAPAKLVMFTGRVQSGCGIADAGAGPFYCPLDKTVYIDPTFYEELKRRFGAPGDFAQAYVIAHEFGHHIQNQLASSCRRCRGGCRRRNTTRLRCGWSFRPTSWRASGPTESRPPAARWHLLPAPLRLGAQPPRARPRMRDRRCLRAGYCRSRLRRPAGVPTGAADHPG